MRRVKSALDAEEIDPEDVSSQKPTAANAPDIDVEVAPEIDRQIDKDRAQSDEIDLLE